MSSRLKLLYIADDLLSPDEFPRIVDPAIACHELSYIRDRDILALFSGFRGGERIRSEAGVTHKGINCNLRAKVQNGLRRGEIVTVDTRPSLLATIGPFYADTKGHLRAQSIQQSNYPFDRIVRRYEEMVKSWGGRRAHPSVFPAQVTRSKPAVKADISTEDRKITQRKIMETVVFRGSRAPEFPEGILNATKKAFLKWDVSGIKNIKDWTNNIEQAIGVESEYYKKAIDIGKAIRGNTDISGHSLGGGMASAASMASGQSAWTFNAAGLNSGTVEKYGGKILGSANNIKAYRIDGELLTSLQEVHNEEDYDLIKNALPQSLQQPWGAVLPFTLKEWGSLAAPDAVGAQHILSGGTGSLLDKHGIDQTIKLIEDEKDNDIATIRSRI